MSDTIRPLGECTTHGQTVIRGWGKSWSMEYCPKCSTPSEMLVELHKFWESEGIGWGLHAGKTSAQKVSFVLGGDGQVWESPEGIDLIDLCNALGARGELDAHRRARYVFPDGSAIVSTTEAWDIEGSTPYSFASQESSDV